MGRPHSEHHPEATGKPHEHLHYTHSRAIIAICTFQTMLRHLTNSSMECPKIQKICVTLGCMQSQFVFILYTIRVIFGAISHMLQL